MKISNALLLIGVSNAKPSLKGGSESKITQKHEEFFDKGSHRTKRSHMDGMIGFRPLAAMMMYTRGFGADNSDPRSNSNFESELADLEETYTSYGCYCWMEGVDAGVIGGGQTKDNTDFHCKELYRCYKCVKNDYTKAYTDVEYFVDFTTGSNGGRELDCKVNAQQDAENICECDKRFAEAIAETEQLCNSNPTGSNDNGAFCMDETYRTPYGEIPGTNQKGTFDTKTCKDVGGGNGITGKETCCGIYPNRYPYNEQVEECCQQTTVNSDTTTSNKFTLFDLGECVNDGGIVVKNDEGDPHTYHAV